MVLNWLDMAALHCFNLKLCNKFCKKTEKKKEKNKEKERKMNKH